MQQYGTMQKNEYTVIFIDQMTFFTDGDGAAKSGAEPGNDAGDGDGSDD